jgi:hypothetical protein
MAHSVNRGDQYYADKDDYYADQANYYDGVDAYYEPAVRATPIIIPSYETTFDGDGSATPYELPGICFPEMFEVWAYTIYGTIQGCTRWLPGVHYTEVANSEGYTTHLTPVHQWPIQMRFLVKYEPILEDA